MKIHYFLGLPCLLLSVFAQANWLEIHSESIIINDKNQARQHALTQALAQAINFAQADTSNIKKLQPFLAQEKTRYQFNHNEIKEILIIEEKQTPTKYEIKTRIQIIPKANSCQKLDYKKNILLNEFTILEPQQASVGKIHKIGKDFTRVLRNNINQQGKSIRIHHLGRFPFQSTQNQEWQLLAEDWDAQYILTGQIIDLTTSYKNTEKYRQFALEAVLINGTTGNITSDFSYRVSAPWFFSKNQLTPTNSATFWQSKYGQVISQVGQQILWDIESTMSCQISRPKIVKIQGDRIYINAGYQQGVRNGDQLRLWHKSQFIDSLGIYRNAQTQSFATIEVKTVSSRSAELTLIESEFLPSLQIGDFLTKQIPH